MILRVLIGANCRRWVQDDVRLPAHPHRELSSGQMLAYHPGVSSLRPCTPGSKHKTGSKHPHRLALISDSDS